MDIYVCMYVCVYIYIYIYPGLVGPAEHLPAELLPRLPDHLPLPPELGAGDYSIIYICIYAYMYINVCISLSIYMYIYIYTHVYMQVKFFMRARLTEVITKIPKVHIYIYIYTCILYM